MAEANLHGCRASANAFAGFNMVSLDDPSADLDVLRSLIFVTIDNIPPGTAGEAENLLHAALQGAQA